MYGGSLPTNSLTHSDIRNCWSPLLTIAHIKIGFSHKMKNDTPFMTEPCKGIHLPNRCKTITANGINYISTLQNRCKCTKTSSIINVITSNLLTSKNTFVVSSSSDEIKPYTIIFYLRLLLIENLCLYASF